MKKLAMMIVLIASGCVAGSDGGTAGLSAGKEGPPPPPEECATCWVTGGGQIYARGTGGSFGGNAKTFRDGSVDGEWNHVTFDGRHFHGDPDTLSCSTTPGRNPQQPNGTATFSGSGTFDGAPVTFSVTVMDNGEPGRADTYSITIFSGSTVVYSASDVVMHGNIQLHPTNNGHPDICQGDGGGGGGGMDAGVVIK